MKKTLYLQMVILWFSAACLAQSPKKAETITLDGKQTYYEVYGEGDPLLLLHGYGQSSWYWRSFVGDFQKDYEVYLVDLQGFGRSDPFDSDWTIRSVAQNLLQLIEHLELDPVRAIGLSYGGDVIMQVGRMDPSRVRSMICIGAIGSWNALDNPGSLEVFSYSNRENLGWMRDHQTSEEQFRSALDYFSNYQVFLSDQDLQTISAKTLIVLGDDDDFALEDVARVRRNLPDADLWIMPHTGHIAHEGDNWEPFLKEAKSFFSLKE
jgi:pimeloyl-ACP methyl ester carboxylesterase